MATVSLARVVLETLWTEKSTPCNPYPKQSDWILIFKVPLFFLHFSCLTITFDNSNYNC